MANLNKLEKKIKDAIQKATEETAYELTFKIESAYESAIKQFYDDYPNPSFYNRTESTYLASDRFESVYDKPLFSVGDSYWAGVNISSNNIPGSPYRAKKFWVFDRTFRQGIHGYTKNEAKEWSVRKHNKEFGIYFKFKRGMGKMKHPPKEIMDVWFRKNITTQKAQKEIDNIFNDALTKQLKKR